jgi:uncharacterized protein (TIRG00374 family)
LQAAEGAKRPTARRLIQAALSLVVIGLVFLYALPKFADFSSVTSAVGQMTSLEIATLVVLAVWNQVTYWLVMVSSLPGSNIWQAMKINQASTAVSNTLPGGSAVGTAVTYGMYSASGFTSSEITLSLLTAGLWNNFVKLSMPIVAVILIALVREPSAAQIGSAAAGIGFLVGLLALITAILSSERAAIRIGNRFGSLSTPVRRVLKKPPAQGWGTGLATFRKRSIVLLRKRGLALTVTTLVSHVSLYLVLLLSLRHVGVSDATVSWIEVLAAFAFIRLLSALPITPGGLGVVELGLTAALVAAGGPKAPVVAGVLVYRALTYLPPIPLGLLAYVRWKSRSEGRRARAEQRRASLAKEPLG